MHARRVSSSATLLLTALLLTCPSAAVLADSPDAATALEAAFRQPPPEARPWVYWFWMNGNLTKEGITADLEAMQRVGVGGTLIMSVSTGILPGKVDFMTPEWRELFAFAVREANRLGIQIIMNNDDGWTGSGGPWNRVENSMQMLTWRELRVEGPKRFDEPLPQPAARLNHYRDIALLAFPTPAGAKIDPASDARLANWPAKTGLGWGGRIEPTDDRSVPPIPKDKILDLSDRLTSDGRLAWDVPEGDWTLLRLGHTSTGRSNHPCTPKGVGLECDKLSKEALEAHYDGFLAKLVADVGPLAGKTLIATHIDSWEVGAQNWTPKLREEFQARRGYDPLLYLPATTGRVVESGQATERFLWDFRKTIAELLADNYFAHLRTLAGRHGMGLSVEAYGCENMDNLQCAARADIPMNEFWTGQAPPMDTAKEAASAGHVMGRKIIAAEAFTATDTNGKWQNHPYRTKALGDAMYAGGINRFVFHRWAMQPWMDRLPGMTFGPWGINYERTVTWFEQSRAWLAYLARCQHLLQEGRFVADLCYFVGEDAPNTGPQRSAMRPAPPAGYDYDGCHDEPIFTMSVRDGRVVLPSGMSYRVLVLPESRFMTPALLAKIRELVAAGAQVVGPKPEMSPSLAGYPECDAQVQRLADALWGDVASPGSKTTGKGTVYWGKSLEDVLAALDVKPDVEFLGPPEAARLWIHRRIAEADVYFVCNSEDAPEPVDAVFRVDGRLPELWHPDTGRVEPAAVWRPTQDGRTNVRFRLEPRGSVFVVFRQPAGAIDPVIGLSHNGKPIVGAVPPAEIRIRKATYGVLDDPARTMDVTGKLVSLVGEGQRSVHVWSTLGGDPAYGVVKTLRVEYPLDGQERTATARDGQTLSFPRTVEPEAPEAELAIVEGKPRLLARKGGRWEMPTASGKKLVCDVPEVPTPIALAGPWELRFPPGWGTPESVTLEKLISWPDHTDDAVRHFSGTAVYRKTFDVPADRLGPGKTLWLDLGQVAVLAEVKLNGKDLGILWKPPFRVEVTEAAQTGRNELEVRVTNLWINRLIGDERKPPYLKWTSNGGPAEWPDWLADGGPAPDTGRYTLTTWHHYEKDSPLVESGLLGPVTLQSATWVHVPREEAP